MENTRLNFEKEYQQKLCTAAEAASIVKSGDYLSLPIGVGEPTLFVRELAARKRELFEVVINQQHPLSPDFFTEDSVPHMKVNSWFTSPAARNAVQKGWTDFVPNNFNEGPRLLSEYWPIDIAGTVVSPMDEHGYFTCSLAVAYTMEAVKKAKKVVVQVNPHAPRAYGNCHIHISEVDYIIECDEPLKELINPDISPVEEAIGGYISELVEDGACLQFGVGGIPNSVCKALLHKKDLGIHTELLSDGMVDLMLSGAVNNSRKQTHRGKTVATLALGTRRLYEFMDENPRIEMHPVDYLLNPHNIGKNDNMV
ncbi:MAG: acetyl-CoA hydrolase/transferase C-terminal domain-containing protein, partial [Desulfuromonadaceae bacterium]